MLDDRDFDYRAALVTHRRQLEQRQAATVRMIRAIYADAARTLSAGIPADSRFAANIDKHGSGLTPYLVAAIRANAARMTNEDP